MAKYRTDITYHGYWFLPGAPNKAIQGVLTIEYGQKASLEIVADENHLSKVFPRYKKMLHNINRQEPIAIINGYAKGNDSDQDQAFTLLNCEIHGYNRSGLTRIVLGVERFLFPVQISSVSDLKYQCAFLRFQHLDDWAGIDGFEVESNVNERKYHKVISYSQPDPVILYNDNSFNFHLYFRASAPAFKVYDPTGAITQTTYVNVDFKRQNGIERVIEVAKRLQDFFSFAVASPVARLDFGLRHHSHQTAKRRDVSNHTCHIIYKDINVYSERRIRNRNMILTLKDTKESSGNVLQLWMNNYESLGVVMKLYFDTFYSSSMHIETKFLNYVVAIEAYHRVRIRSSGYLKDRIMDMLKKHRKISRLMVPSMASFAKNVVMARNRLAHGDSRISKRYIEPNTLFEYSETLRIILQCCLLNELGFNQDQILTFVKRVSCNWYKLG